LALNFLVSGVGLIFVLLALQGGLSQALYGVRDRWLRSVAERRGILVPSLVADSRSDREAQDDAVIVAASAVDDVPEPSPPSPPIPRRRREPLVGKVR
jgi:hypothetical protein